MQQQTPATPRRTAIPQAVGVEPLMIVMLQALTNGCTCDPCQTLRSYAKALADALAHPGATPPPQPRWDGRGGPSGTTAVPQQDGAPQTPGIPIPVAED